MWSIDSFYGCLWVNGGEMAKEVHKTTGVREIILCRVTQNKKVAMDWYAFEVSPSDSFAALYEGLVLASQNEHGRFKTKIAKDGRTSCYICFDYGI